VPRFEGTRKFPGELAREPGARLARAARALRRGVIEPCKRPAGAAVCSPARAHVAQPWSWRVK